MKEIAKGVFIETSYPGVNVGAIWTDGGFICVDVPSVPRDARHWFNALTRLRAMPLRYLILTDYIGDRAVNTRGLGAPIIVHELTAQELGGQEKRATPSVSENLFWRGPKLTKDDAAGTAGGAAVSFSKEMSIADREHKVVLRHAPGPSRGSIWVHLVDKDILFAGDTVTVGTIPQLSEMCGREWQQTLRRLSAEEGQARVIVPGRGPASDGTAAVAMAEFLEKLQSIAERNLLHGRPREAYSDYGQELLQILAIDEPEDEWVQGQITLALGHFYREIELEQRFVQGEESLLGTPQRLNEAQGTGSEE